MHAWHTYVENKWKKAPRITHSHKSTVIKIIIKINIYLSWLLPQVSVSQSSRCWPKLFLANENPTHALHSFQPLCWLHFVTYPITTWLSSLFFFHIWFHFSVCWCEKGEVFCRMKIKPMFTKHQIIIIDHNDFRFICIVCLLLSRFSSDWHSFVTNSL